MFGDKKSLKLAIVEQVAMVQYLNETGNIEGSERLARNVSYLSQKLLQGGMIVDPLHDIKYYVSHGELLGGGDGTGKCGTGKSCTGDVDGFKACELYGKQRNVVEAMVSKCCVARNALRTSSIIIKNQTSYPLVHLSQGSDAGWFFTDILSAYCGTHNGVEAILGNSYGGILHTKHGDGNHYHSSCGYISFLFKAMVEIT